MAGHSHWAGIKHKKEAADKKRGRIFAKLLNTVSVSAKNEPNPNFNPRLRTAIEKAREASVPKDKIDTAIKRITESPGSIEELLFGAYGPEGTAIIIEAISDSKNRAVAEIKKILNDFGGKWAEPDAVAWAFEKTASGWQSRFTQELSGQENKNKLTILLDALKNHDDVQNVYTNAE